MLAYTHHIIGESPYMSRAIPPNDFSRAFRDNLLVQKLTKQYILKVIADGISRYGGNISEYEKAVGLKKQGVKDIRRVKRCPPADIWQKIAVEAGIEKTEGQKTPAIDENLMESAFRWIDITAKKEGKILVVEEEVLLSTKLYNHIIKYRNQGIDIKPDEERAALIINAAA